MDAEKKPADLPVLYLNENIEYSVKGILEAAGFSVVHALDVGNGGKDDEDQLIFSTGKGWVLITHNR